MSNNHYYYNAFDDMEFNYKAMLLTDPKYETDLFNNSDFIFSKDSQRQLDDFVTQLNNNVIVMGTSGCGKTTRFVDPNIRQAAGNIIASDPKGNLVKKHGRFLEEEGYRILVMDFQHPEHSIRWNPLSNVRTTQDIMRISNALTYDYSEGQRSIDPFWDQSTVMFFNGLIGYMLETGYKPMNFQSIVSLLHEGRRFSRNIIENGVRRTDENCSKLRDRFDELKKKNPNSWACEQFYNVDSAPERTFGTVRTCVAAKLANYTTQEIATMMSGNDLDFEELAKEKFALFIIQSDCDRSMDRLVNLFISQAINSLCSFADRCENSRLPIPVRFFLDDYGATTVIDNLDTIISTIRSRAISVSLILQSESQLAKGKAGTEKTILSNCDTYIYMGGNDIETAKAVSTRCNKPLEQVLYMPVGYCWVFERGKKPVFSETAKQVEYEQEKML